MKTETMTMHTPTPTPTPWKVDNEVFIRAENGRDIALTNVNARCLGDGSHVPIDRVNAAFIVRAVNSHHSFITYLQAVGEFLKANGFPAMAEECFKKIAQAEGV